MDIRKGTRNTGEKGYVFFKCDHCKKESKINGEEVIGTIMVLEDMFDNL